MVMNYLLPLEPKGQRSGSNQRGRARRGKGGKREIKEGEEKKQQTERRGMDDREARKESL
jgi:hypothetical protein